MEENVALDSAKQKQFLKSIKGINKLVKKGKIKPPLEIKKKPVSDTKKKRKQRKEKGLVYLGHIPHGFYENQMTQYFKQFGKVTNCRVIRSKRTGNSKGYAFVEFGDTTVAQIVAETMNNYLMGKRLLKAEYIPPEKQKRKAMRKHWSKFNNPGNDARIRIKKEVNKDKTEKEELAMAKTFLKTFLKVKENLSKLGVHYDFVQPVDVPEELKDKLEDKKENKEDSSVTKMNKSKNKLENESKPKKDEQKKKTDTEKTKVLTSTQPDKPINKKQQTKAIKTETKPKKEDQKNKTDIEKTKVLTSTQPDKPINKKQQTKALKAESQPPKVKMVQQKKLVAPLEDFIGLDQSDTDDSEGSDDFDSDEFDKLDSDEVDEFGSEDASLGSDEDEDGENSDSNRENDESEEKVISAKKAPLKSNKKTAVQVKENNKKTAAVQLKKNNNANKRKVPNQDSKPTKKQKFEKKTTQNNLPKKRNNKNKKK